MGMVRGGSDVTLAPRGGCVNKIPRKGFRPSRVPPPFPRRPPAGRVWTLGGKEFDGVKVNVLRIACERSESG